MPSRIRITALLAAAVLPAVAFGCSDADGGAGSGPRAPGELVQLDPPPGTAPLTAPELARVVAAAREDPITASALRQGDVRRVLVRAAPGGTTAAFLFAGPVTPADDPYDVLCDIAGQTPEWRGVAARVGPGGAVESSPVWLTGATCVGMVVPG